MSERIKITGVRVAFPNLYVPTATQGSDQKRYGCTFLVEKGSDADKTIRSALVKTATEKWGDEGMEMLKRLTVSNKTCYNDGEMKSHLAGYSGKWFLNASSLEKPTVVGRDCSPMDQSNNKIRSGCLVRGIVEIWAMDNQYGKRLCASLGGVQFELDDGTNFGAGSGAAKASDFDLLEEGAEGADMSDGFDAF